MGKIARIQARNQHNEMNSLDDNVAKKAGASD